VYGVEPICKMLPIAPSTYHAHVARRSDPAKLSPRGRRDLVLAAEIRRVFEANFRVYGVRKVWRQLGCEGIAAARCTVARLMRQIGIQGAVRGREVRTTVSNPAVACPLDRVMRIGHEAIYQALYIQGRGALRRELTACLRDLTGAAGAAGAQPRPIPCRP